MKTFFSLKLRVGMKDNNNSPHCKFHRFLFPFSSEFSVRKRFRTSRGSRGGAWGGALFWVKNEEMTEGRKAGWVSKIEPSPFLS